jgi:hypothetical protein
MAILDDLLQRIKRATLDKTNLDERIVNAIKPQIQRAAPIIQNSFREAYIEPPKQIARTFNNISNGYNNLIKDYLDFMNPFSAQSKARNIQFAQQTNTMPNFSQPLEGLRKATPGAQFMFKQPLAPEPANATQRALRIAGAAVPSLINGAARGASLLSSGKDVLLNSILGGGINKLFGGDFGEGASAGAEALPMIQSIASITNPLISRTAQRFGGRFASPLIKNIMARAASGVGNIPEGFIMNKALGQGYNVPQAALDFAIGTVLPGETANLEVKQNLIAGEHATGFDRAPGKFSSRLDRLPRFEISDRQASMKSLPEMRDGLVTTLGKILNHQGLFKQYPGFENITVKFEKMSSGSNGKFNKATNVLTLDPNLSRKETRSTLLHEIEHAIQKVEGFASGGSVGSADKEKLMQIGRNRDELINMLKVETDPTRRQLIVKNINEYGDQLNSVMDGPYKDYRRQAGEIEARAVQGREGLSPKQRRSIDPYAGTMNKDNIKLKDVLTNFGNKQPNLAQGKPVLNTGEFKNNAVKNIDPLMQEARKYKSAEEFVKAQTPVYHGSPVELKQFHNKSGVFFADNYADASGFGGNPDNVYEGYLNFKKPLVIDAKGAKWDELNTKYGKSTMEVIGNAQKEGYDGVTFKNIVDNMGDTADFGGQGTIHYAFKPKTSFLNESQLTDIYNQAKSSNLNIAGDGSTPINDNFFFRRTRKMLADNATTEASKQGTNLQDVFKTNEKNVNQSVPEYVKSMSEKQNSAKNSGVTARFGKVAQNIRTLFEDYTAPIEDELNSFEKRTKSTVLPTQDVRPQIDRAIRADSIGTQFIKDNGLDKVIQQVPDLNEFNQYLIAKQARDITATGRETGRNLEMDNKLVTELGPKYEPFAQQVYKYNDSLRKYLVDSGLISQDLSNTLAKEYPNYVPLKRIFNETELDAMRGGTGRGGPASIGSQSVVKKLEGSTREIVNPIESMLESTATAFREGERNKAAQMVGSYIKNGIFPGKVLASEGDTTGKSIMSALINGKKVRFETTPEIAQAAKNLNSEQLNSVLKIAAVPVRVLRLFATGLNIPFTAGNLAKDQIMSTIVSDKPLRTSLLNPVNFISAVLSATKHDKLYKEWVGEGAAFSSFDIGRDQTPITIDKIRSEKNLASKIKYTARNPMELLRALEDQIGVSEEITRLQQYRGTKGALIDAGRTEADAKILAAKASRNNTANFGRRGAWGQVLNALVPFFNAGVQGARSLRTSFKNDPVGTSVRFTATVGIPVMAATAWNLSDPERKAAYEDIPDYEKENNIIILPEKVRQDDKGNYNAIKIPMPQGISNLSSILRRETERLHGIDSGGIMAAINDLLSATTSQPLANPAEFATQNTPQIIKLAAEPALNVNFFTGKQIEPSYMQKKPPAERYFDSTSGTARKLGEIFNMSPLKIENEINTGGAGVGKQLLNLSDRVLAKTGQIPEDQIGGKSVMDDFKSRFLQAKGGEIERKSKLPDFSYGKKADAATEDVPPAMPKGTNKPVVTGTPISTSKMKAYNKEFGMDVNSALPEGTNFEKATKKAKQFEMVNKVLNSDKLTETEKDQYLSQATDFKPEEIGYYKVAKSGDDERYGFVLDKVGSQPADLIKTLSTMRYEINGKQILTNNLIDRLKESDYLTDTQAKMLKKVKYDQTIGKITYAGKSGGGSGKKTAKAIASLNKQNGEDLRKIFEKFSTASVKKGKSRSLIQITKQLGSINRKVSNSRKIKDVLGTKRTIKPIAKFG